MMSHHESAQHQSELMKMFADQQEGKRTKTFSEGSIGPSDEGDLAFMIGSDPEKNVVHIEFPKPVAWVALPPQQAVELAQMLIKHARAISTTPIRINLH